MNEIEKILEDIRNNRCILFLGPLMTVVRYKGKRKSLTEIFSDHILQKLNNTTVLSNAEEASRNSYYLMSKYISHVGGRTNFEKEFLSIRDKFFYPLSSIYYFLAKIPFNTIINFGSDHLMNRALYKAGYEFYSAYYNFQGDRQDNLPDLDDKVQLVYNLLGSINDSQSQVLTEADQLEFLKQIASDRKLPNNLLTRLKEDKDGTKSYIFLGFNFEEWPFRFLLNTLQIPKSEHSSAPKIPGYNIALMTEDFYKERFGLKFLKESPEDFAKFLIKEYTTSTSLINHKNGFISFHNSDISIVNDFKDHLEPSGLARRIDFWDRSELIASDVTEKKIKEKLGSSTIYIPFISIKFLNDDSLASELRYMLNKPNILIFPVITRTCQFDYEFPELIGKARLILPGIHDVLVDSNKNPTDKDYTTMVKKINSAIR